MAEFQLVIISVSVILMLPFAAGGAHTSSSVSVGGEITLLCQDAKDFHDGCYSTTWLFGRSRSEPTVPLFEHGKLHRDVGAQSARLSVTENCSLVIKKVTTLDGGHYTCRQFVSGHHVSDSMVILSVLNTGTPVFNSPSNGPRDIFPGKDATNATTTTAKPTSTPPPAQTPTTPTIMKTPTETTTTKPDMATTIITSVTTTTTVTSLMTKTTMTTTTETVSPDKITTTKSNTTTITMKSPKKTTTFNSTTTKTTIKSPRAAEECTNTVHSTTMLIIVAAGFAALIIMLAVIIWQIRKRNKTQTSDNIERSTNHCVGPGTSVERVLSEHNQDHAAASSNVRASYTSSGASTDGSGIYATMKRI